MAAIKGDPGAFEVGRDKKKESPGCGPREMGQKDDNSFSALVFVQRSIGKGTRCVKAKTARIQVGPLGLRV